MEDRRLGRIGYQGSAIGFGARASKWTRDRRTESGASGANPR